MAKNSYLLFLLAFLLLNSSQPLAAESGSDGEFHVLGYEHRPEGKLVFNYYTPYPGMTKVKLFKASGELLWRGQYLNQKGTQIVQFRAHHLEAGQAYIFQFDYKLKTVRIPVTG